MIVGREEELARIEAALDRARPVVVVGPPGIGKTTLGRHVLDGRGPYRNGSALATLRWVPFLPYRRMLAVPPLEDPEQVAAQVLDLGPGALLVDDLQWADGASLEVTCHLATRVPLVVTVRSGDDGTDRALDALGSAAPATVEVGALPPDVADALARARHPDMTAAHRQALLDRAAGNPLLLAELAVDAEPSPTATRALQARLVDLPPRAREAMARLAVAGRPVPPAVIDPGADELVASGLAHVRKGHVEVHHALLAEAVVAGLDPEALAAHQREVAPRLPAAEGSRLLRQVGDRAAARQLALAAVEQAETDRDRAEALRVAIDCAPAGEVDLANRLRAAEVLVRVGELEPALAVCSVAPEARAGLPRAARGELSMHAASAAWQLGRTDEFLAHGAAATDDLRGTRTEAEVRVLAGSTLVDTRIGLDGRPALARAREAVALADDLGVAQGFARARLASVLLTSGEPGWAEMYEAVIARAERDGDDDLRYGALDSLVLAHWVAGDPQVARDLARRHAAELLGAPDGHRGFGLVSYAAVLDLLLGADRSACEARWAPALARPRIHRTRPFLEAAVGLARADLGRHRGAEEVLDGAERRAGPDPQWRSVALWARADAALAAGRLDDSVREAEACAALGVGDYPAAVLARLAGGHARLEQGEPADDGRPPPVALLPAWAGAPIEWRGLVAWGEGRWSDAIAHLDAAAAAWAGHDVRGRARCQWSAAEVARRADDPSAPDRLAAAEVAAEAVELTALASRVRKSLRASGVRRAAPRRPGQGGLSARETEVLDLVGAGRTTAEIAGELRVEAATVEQLVRSALRRLGAGSRIEGAALLARLRAEAPPDEHPAHPGG